MKPTRPFPPQIRDGNHNGLIEAAEAADVWNDLAGSIGFVRPSSPIRGGVYTFATRTFFGSRAQNCISVNNVPNRDAQSIDARHDDGVSTTGNIHSTAAYDGSDTLVTLYWRI